MYLSSEFLFSHWSGSPVETSWNLFVCYSSSEEECVVTVNSVMPFNLYCAYMLILLVHILAENENKMTVIIYWSSVCCFFIFPCILGVHKIKVHFFLPFVFVISVPLLFYVLTLMSSYVRLLLGCTEAHIPSFVEMLCIWPKRTQSFSLIFFLSGIAWDDFFFLNFWAILMKNDSLQMAFWINCSYFILPPHIISSKLPLSLARRSTEMLQVRLELEACWHPHSTSKL